MLGGRMGMNPSFMLLFERPRLDEVLRALVRVSTPAAHVHLTSHLPWQAARVEAAPSGPVAFGIRGWHGWGPDRDNCYGFGLRLGGGEWPCDLSLCAGERLGLLELCAANDAAASAFFEPRLQDRLAERLDGVVRALCFDNESGEAWRPLLPERAAWKLPWGHQDLGAYRLAGVSDDLAFDIDALAGLLLDLLRT
jgi:hypothetical protein